MSRFRLLAAGAAIALLGGFTFFHLHLTASVPASDTTVATAPSQILLTFSDKPEAALTRLQLFTSDSTAVETGKATATKDSLTLAIPVTGKLSDGAYTVRWRAAGRDGHPATGTFGFTVKQASAAVTSRDRSAN
jgi:methionine-rich copper-binding protein CopC